VSFADERPNIPLSYPCGKVTIRNVLAFKPQYGCPQPGDSGSPVIDADGTLYGMYFYMTNGGDALVIPAYDLFDKRLFGRDLNLV
jgi:hypothetical protein